MLELNLRCSLYGLAFQYWPLLLACVRIIGNVMLDEMKLKGAIGTHNPWVIPLRTYIFFYNYTVPLMILFCFQMPMFCNYMYIWMLQNAPTTTTVSPGHTPSPGHMEGGPMVSRSTISPAILPDINVWHPLQGNYTSWSYLSPLS